MAWLVGTSGWQYRDWRGGLYPPGVPQKRWLEHYAEHFETVENNNSFYRLPPRETFVNWAERTPDGFVMTVKASRYLTHVRRLKDPGEPVQRLLDAATGLGGRLGPILVQLPPNWKGDPGLMDGCLAEFARRGPRGLRVAVELRHESCWTDEMRQVLTDRGAALVWADRGGSARAPLWQTAGWGYLRLHEGSGQPWPRYRQATLRTWVKRLAAAWPGGEDVYVYFNNDQGGAAVHDAVAFAATARRAGQEVSRVRPVRPADPEVSRAGR
ncbi:MAG: DUF72 domain-containing protein [Actinobacteria bacterium]|nr:DUF72 domain-containing protein [Actinomycetota bacterium]